MFKMFKTVGSPWSVSALPFPSEGSGGCSITMISILKREKVLLEIWRESDKHSVYCPFFYNKVDSDLFGHIGGFCPN